jgi:hypothetical protein
MTGPDPREGKWVKVADETVGLVRAVGQAVLTGGGRGIAVEVQFHGEDHTRVVLLDAEDVGMIVDNAVTLAEASRAPVQ